MMDADKAQNYEFHPSISNEEREFYLKAYPTPDNVRDRRTHCTTCKMHLGTAPGNIENIKMHPILRVTHCPKCQDFYNCGEFSKGEDGSELYCRWCGQGGEVYCCSSCPFVFCKSCITKNLSRGVVADIEQNENWRCFACAPKILWPLRAVHWALTNYIEKQKKEIEAMNLTEEEKRLELAKDRSNCCRLAKAKCGNMSDSMDSIDSALSKRSQSSNPAAKKKLSTPSPQTPAPKRLKTSNNEVVCTPDLLSMLEPDCQLTVTPKPKQPQARPIGPKVVQVQQNYTPPQARSLAPPPLIQLRSPNVQLRPLTSNAPVIRRTVVSPRTPSPAGSQSPVYHTINGYRIDLNSAAQQGTYRLPNGKLIQVKRQSAPVSANQNPTPSPVNNWQQRTPIQSPVQRLQLSATVSQPRSFVSVQQQQQQQQQSTPAPPLRYPSGMVGSTVISAYNQNGPQIQMVNGGVNVVNAQPAAGQSVQIRPVMVRQTFPNNAYGVARSQFQDQIFNAMEICQHLTGKIQTLTNSNAYKTAKNYLELKELYIHMSYLLTYAIGRFKGLQDKCLGDMRQLGFGNDADSLENGQLAAGVDYVRYGQLEDVDLFTANMNSFHNQIYEYRKSLLANMEHLEDRPPLSPLHDLNGLNDEVIGEPLEQNTIGAQQTPRKTSGWHSTTNYEDDDDDVQEVAVEDESSTLFQNTFEDDDGQDFDDTVENEFYGGAESGGGGSGAQRSTEDVMRREEESHAYDRKLTRLIQQYPSIWCTRHPDYGNFEVTRKQWRTIASHFTYSADMKMRWKNIRKRYVRIERRMHEGKRFNGYFDKATNFLVNRDRPMNDWVQIDCGTGDGDVYERQKLDQIEKELHGNEAGSKAGNRQKSNDDYDEPLDDVAPNRPVEIKPLDTKIIHFVKCNPVLWRKSTDPQFHKMDEQTRKSLWMHLWKSVPYVRCSDLVDRWTQLYEMYKTFRLKTIKSERALAALELKYSKYLAKLYFLYKIDEEELINEDKVLIFGDPFDEESEEQANTAFKVLDRPDDKEFVLALVRAVRHYPAIWDENNQDYHDMLLREESWQEIQGILEKYGHKQASDNEDDEIEIVEPKTDTINLDSDEETAPTPTPHITKPTIAAIKQHIQKINIPAKIRPVQVSAPEPMLVPIGSTEANDDASTGDDMTDFMSAAHSLLASMLEVDIIEGDSEIQTSPKKQPRKKTTNKPNPTLLKQKRMLERQKMQELKQNDTKLKMNCLVNVPKIDTDYPNFEEKLAELEKRRKEWREEQAKLAQQAKVKKAQQQKEESTAKPGKMESSQSAKTAEAADATKADVENKAIPNQKTAPNSPFKIVGVTSLTTDAALVVPDESKGETAVLKATTLKVEVDAEVDEAEKLEENEPAVETSSLEDEVETKVAEVVKLKEELEPAVETNIEEMETETTVFSADKKEENVEKTETVAEKEEPVKKADNAQEEAIEEKLQDTEKTVEAQNAVEFEDEKLEESKKEVSCEETSNGIETEGTEFKDILAAKKEDKVNDENAMETEQIDDDKAQNKANELTVEISEEKNDKKESMEKQETANGLESEKSTPAAVKEPSVDVSVETLEDLETETNSATAELNFEAVNSEEKVAETMQVDMAEDSIEELNNEFEEIVAQVDKSNGSTESANFEPAETPNNEDEELMEEIEKVLTAGKEFELESLKELVELETNESPSIEQEIEPELIKELIELEANEPLSTEQENEQTLTKELPAFEANAPPSSTLDFTESEVAFETCLETKNSHTVPTTMTTADITEKSVFEEICEKLDFDPTPLELPIAKSDELILLDANNTAQSDDVEMATLPIEMDI